MRTEAVSGWYFCQKLFLKLPREFQIEILGSSSQEKRTFVISTPTSFVRTSI